MRSVKYQLLQLPGARRHAKGHDGRMSELATASEAPGHRAVHPGTWHLAPGTSLVARRN